MVLDNPLPSRKETNSWLRHCVPLCRQHCQELRRKLEHQVNSNQCSGIYTARQPSNTSHQFNLFLLNMDISNYEQEHQRISVIFVNRPNRQKLEQRKHSSLGLLLDLQTLNRCPTGGPRAASGPPTLPIRPARARARPWCIRRIYYYRSSQPRDYL